MTAVSEMARARALAALSWAHSLIASQLPALLAASLFLPGVPVPIGRMAFASAAGLLLMLAWVHVRAKDSLARVDRRASFSLAVVVLVAYPALAALARLSPRDPADSFAGAAYLIASPWMVRGARRVWGRDRLGLAMVLAGLLCASVVLLWQRGWDTYLLHSVRAEKGIVDAMTRAVPLGRGKPTDPDILHIVLDGMSREDTLRSWYGVPAGVFRDLESEGIVLQPDAVANYSHTYQALSSALNMHYLDALTPALGAVQDRRPLLRSIADNAAARSLRDRGYEIVVVGSGFDVTTGWRQPDRCLGCSVTVPGLFESALVSIGPWRSLGLWHWLFNAHRTRIVGAIDALANMPPSDRPRLVFAHLMIPHPPFLLGPRGALSNPRRAFDILDEALYRGSRQEYLDGYAAQATFALQALKRVVKRAVAESSRGVVVVVHGDHGAGQDFDASNPASAATAERMSILLGLKWPTQCRPEAVRSPVNIYRRIFDGCFGAVLPALPDRSFLPEAERPYVFHEVAPPFGSASAAPANVPGQR